MYLYNLYTYSGRWLYQYNEDDLKFGNDLEQAVFN